MSKADEIFIANVKDILDNGYRDTEDTVRPHWPDGTPAHTVKILYRKPLRSERGVPDNHIKAKRI